MTWLLALVLAGTVAPQGLHGVVNAEKSNRLPAAAKEALVRDGFTVVAGHERHFFSLYDRNAYEKVPSFISSDVVLHVFHVRFDDEVASLEQQFAVSALKSFATRQLARAVSVTPAQRWLVQYHATALALLEPNAKVDASVAADVKRTVEGKGTGSLSACPDPVDFSLFTPRGHYDHFGLQGYFRAVTFYAQCGFALKGESLGRAEALSRLIDAESAKDLGRVRALQAFVSGPSDDPGTDLFASLPPWPEPVLSPARAVLAEKRSRLPAPAVASLDPGPRFRLLGGSATPDGALLGRVDRAVPSVLDVLQRLSERPPARPSWAQPVDAPVRKSKDLLLPK